MKATLFDQFCDGKVVYAVGNDQPNDIGAAHPHVVLAEYKLQDVADYRSTLRDWFQHLETGGHLIVTVPHAFLSDRRLNLPSPWRPRQRRLYTPASLLAEVEEALQPNTYRVRWLGDLDGNYDYRLGSDQPPQGESDIALVLERISPPAWSLTAPAATSIVAPLTRPDFAFDPEVTRVEVDARTSIRRVLILKLDHLGDFIMSLPALERMRRYFPSAAIDLVVGSWNVAMARDLGLADHVIGFDAFPRNSSEEEPNVPATVGFFRSLVTAEYDLAVDLRTDIDTRPLLKEVRATFRAGIGTRARFPFLDVALPLDDTRNDAERVREERIPPNIFLHQGSARRSHFALYSDKKTVERDCAIIWGPYIELDPGDYLFDFYLDLEEPRGDGLLRLDVALDRGRSVSEMIVSEPSNYLLNFRVDKPKTSFEARISTVDGHPSFSFGFHGGRLIKKAPGNVLHQTEYSCLLVELVKLRTLDFGELTQVVAA